MCLGAPPGVPQEQNASMSQNEETPGQLPESPAAKAPANPGNYDANSITALEGL